MRGRFITLEGGEGVGKSTQLRQLAAAIRTRGHDVMETREPGGSPGAEAIRTLLLTGAVDRWDVRTEALLFAAARADHVARAILPALDGGQWVLCDRFIDSSIAYQGVAGELGTEAIRRLHAVGSNDLYPDRTLLLTLDADAAANRTAARDGATADRIGGRGGTFHRQVAEAFEALAQSEPARFRVIDASGTAEEVTDRLIAEIEDLL